MSPANLIAFIGFCWRRIGFRQRRWAEGLGILKLCVAARVRPAAPEDEGERNA